MTNWQLDTFVRELRRLWPDTHEVSGWRTRNNRTSFIAGGPIGTVNHHTVSPNDAGAVNTVTNGWPGASGPIYNVLVLSTGAVHLIAAGPANHAGRGSGAVRDRVRAGQPPGVTGADTMNGNQSFFGIAARHVGTNPTYPARQIDGIVAVNAAFMLARGFTANRAIHHREWTRRKIDMSWQGDLRARVAAAMRGTGGGGSTPPVNPPIQPTNLLRWIMSLPGAPANLTYSQFLDQLAARVWDTPMPRHSTIANGVETATDRLPARTAIANISTNTARTQLRR